MSDEEPTSPTSPISPSFDLDLTFEALPLQKVDTINSVTSVLSTNSVANDNTQPYFLRKLHEIRYWIIFICWIFISGGVFSGLEPGWSYLDAVYFAFISMTGIGYGDLMVTQPWAIEYWHYFLFTTVAFFAIFLNGIGTLFKERFLAQQERQRKRREKRNLRRQRMQHLKERDISGPIDIRPISSVQNLQKLKEQAMMEANTGTWPRMLSNPRPPEIPVFKEVIVKLERPI